jgi:uncharacterized protein (DUF697 family)
MAITELSTPLQVNPELQAFLKKQAEQGKAKADERDASAEKVIWTNVLVNAGMGLAPVGINVLTFVAANVTMIVALGHIYGYTLNREQAGGLIRQMLMSVGVTWAIAALGYKLLVEIIKVAGIATLGVVTAVAMGLDGVLCGALSYALGYTAMTYFKKGCELDKKAMGEAVRSYFAQGKSKVKEAVTNRS